MLDIVSCKLEQFGDGDRDEHRDGDKLGTYWMTKGGGGHATLPRGKYGGRGGNRRTGCPLMEGSRLGSGGRISKLVYHKLSFPISSIRQSIECHDSWHNIQEQRGGNIPFNATALASRLAAKSPISSACARQDFAEFFSLVWRPLVDGG